MQPRGILETVLYADDLITAEKFYGDVLDLRPFVQVAGRYLFYRCGNQVVLIFNPEATRQVSTADIPLPTHGAYGPGHLCFRASADEINRWRDQLAAHGVEIEMDFEWPQGGRSIYFRDPAGNSLEFAEPRIWELEL